MHKYLFTILTLCTFPSFNFAIGAEMSEDNSHNIEYKKCLNAFFQQGLVGKELTDLLEKDTLSVKILKCLFANTYWEDYGFPFRNGRLLDRKWVVRIRDHLPKPNDDLENTALEWIKNKMLNTLLKNGPKVSLYFLGSPSNGRIFRVCWPNYYPGIYPPKNPDIPYRLCEEAIENWEVSELQKSEYVFGSLLQSFMTGLSYLIKISAIMGDSIPYGVEELQAGRFLNTPVAPRGRALGIGFVGLADDASALYWNPAGLALLKYSEILVSYQIIPDSTWQIPELPLNYISKGVWNGIFTFPWGEHGTVGVGGTYSTAKNIASTRIPSIFNMHEVSMTIGVGQVFPHGLRLGGSIKLLIQQIDTYHKNSLTMDLGTIYPLIIFGREVRMGISTQNVLGTRAAYEKIEQALPTKCRFGIAVPRFFSFMNIMVGIESEIRQPRNIHGALGCEIECFRANNKLQLSISNMGLAVGIEHGLSLLATNVKLSLAYQLWSNDFIQIGLSTSF